MKTGQIIKVSMAGVFALLFFIASVQADLYFETEQVSRGIPGQPDGTAVLKQYFSSDATMIDLGDRITIMNFKEKMVYDLEKASRTYTSNAIDKMGMESFGIEAEGEEQNALLQTMLQTMAQNSKVTPTSEVKTIQGYKCRKYVIDIMMTSSQYWVTREFTGYDEMKSIAERATQAFMNNPLMRQMNVLGMMKELDGYPVHTITQIMNGTITSTLKKTEQKKLDPSLFKVPAGYKMVK
jgi:hypothetical protein